MLDFLKKKKKKSCFHVKKHHEIRPIRNESIWAFEELALFIKRTEQEKEMVVYQIQRTSFPKIDILIIYIRLQSVHIKCFCSN